MDPNQNPFASYTAAAPAAPAPVAPAPAPMPAMAPPPAPAAPMGNVPAGHYAPAPPPADQLQGDGGVPAGFGGQSLQFTGGDDPNAKTVRLRDRLNEADTERRKDEEAAIARERAAEIRREERLKKIKYMEDMPDSTPAGTGMCCWILVAVIFVHCNSF